MADVTLELAPICDAGDWRLEPITGLYQRAFPLSEQRPPEFLRQIAARPDYAFLAGMIGGDVAGFSVVYRSASGFGLLEYMAVVEGLRGRGAGAELFRATTRHCAAPLLLEVEAPDKGVQSLEARRVEFYRNLNCRMVPQLRYTLPQLTAEAPPPMRLMLTNYEPAAVAKTQLRDWITDIYRNVYGQPEDDPAIAGMLAPLPDSVAL